MTFDELSNKLNGGPIFVQSGELRCEIAALQENVIAQLSQLIVWETGFPGCYAFTVPVDEGIARYTGVMDPGTGHSKHRRGVLELLPFLD